jgi:hypothetical protein
LVAEVVGPQDAFAAAQRNTKAPISVATLGRPGHSI